MNGSPMISPYRGLTPYTETDAPYFFGRTAEIAAVIANLKVARLTIFYGPSGVGKTSVLRAGVLYQLQQQAQTNLAVDGRPQSIPVYFNRWQHDPLTGLTQAVAAAVQPFLTDNRDSPSSSQARVEKGVEGESEQSSFVTALRAWSDQTKSDLLLILDQFEEHFLYHTGATGAGAFADELVQAINCPHLRVNFVLSLREDALARLDLFKGRISFLLNNRLSIAHLRREAAREAVVQPLRRYSADHGASYTIEPSLVEAVLDQVAQGKVALAHRGAGMTAAEAATERIETPYLQVVLTRLWEQEQSEDSTTLHTTTLDRLGGAEKIISNYLDDTMASLPASHQAIAARFFDRLITLGGTKIALSRDELIHYAKADPAEVQKVLQELEAKRLVRSVATPTGATQYEIFHDVLAQAILDWQSRVPWRAADRYLDAGLFDCREAKQKGQTEILLDHDRYLSIWSHKEAFGALSEETNEFLARTAVCQGEASFSYWLNRLSSRSQPAVASIIKAYILQPSENTRKAAQTAIIQANHSKQLTDETAMHFATKLWDTFQSTTVRVERESTAPILWALRDRVEPAHLSKVLPVVLLAWVRVHRTVLATALGSSAAVLLILLAIWFVREQLRGSWREVKQQLFAGPVSALALSPSNPDIVYLVTPRGQKVEEGPTLLQRREPNGDWEVLKSNIADDPIDNLIVVEANQQRRLYATVYHQGIIRSDDEGQTWQPINSGLLSFMISALVSDPAHPNTLYAGSGQQRGVFVSQDGGDTWHDISGGEDELFGRSISAMAFTKFEGGALVVSTDDGPIWLRTRYEEVWHPAANLSGIGVVLTMAAEPHEGQWIYAGTSNGTFLVSADGGRHWSSLGRRPGVFSISSIVVRPEHPKEIFLSTYGIGGYLVWRSEDSGTNWQVVGETSFSRERINLYVHPQRINEMYAVGDSGFFESADFGSTWTFALNLHAPLASVHTIAIGPIAGNPFYVAVGGAIYVNHNPEQDKWQRGQNLLALTVNDIAIDPANPNKAFAGVHLPNRWSIFQTVDGGKTWEATKPPANMEERFFNYTSSVAVARINDNSVVYAGTNLCGVVSSEDGGKTWNALGRPNCFLASGEPKNVIDLTVAPHSLDTLYVAADRTKVYMSVDRGNHWKQTEVKVSGEINGIQADPTIDGRVYLMAGSQGFWRSDDGTATWQNYSTGLAEKFLIDLVVVPQTPETLFVASSDGGVWRTTDGGKHWQSIRENLSTSTVTTLAYNEHRHELYVGSSHNKLYKFEPGSLAKIGR